MKFPPPGSPSIKHAGQYGRFVPAGNSEARVTTPCRGAGFLSIARWAALPLFLFVAVAGGRLVAGHPAQGGGIKGTVKDPTGRPVSNAKVTLNRGDGIVSPGSVTTPANGRYEITLPLPGAYVVCAEAPGYQESQREGIVVTADAMTVLDFTLTRAQTSPAKQGTASAETTGSGCQKGFFDNSGMKAAGFSGSVDPSGYSASAGAQTRGSLMEGAVDLRKQANAPSRDERIPAASDLNSTPALAESRLRQLQEADPKGFQANHRLGEFYWEAGKGASAIPFLETARRDNPADYDNDYLLARAYAENRRLPEARSLIAETMALRDTAELHNLLAQVAESQGERNVALKEYERTFQMAPSEDNRYDWGLELLLAGDPASALKLFQEGVALNPQSARLWIGLGIALYCGGHSEDAVSAFLHATDLNPADPRPYLFLGKAYDLSNNSAAAVNSRLSQWIQLEPQNAQAYYYGALSLWKGKRNSGLVQDRGEIESLLKESALLDPIFPLAHLQLANLYMEENRILEANGEYQNALRLKPDLAEAHYRLGQAFLRTGQKELGQQQMAIYEQLHGKQPADSHLIEGRSLVESVKRSQDTNRLPP